MDLIKILNSIDFIDGRVDLNSVHPTRLNLLVNEGLIDKIDPGDGESCFYVMASEEIMEKKIWSELNKRITYAILWGKPSNFNKN